MYCHFVQGVQWGRRGIKGASTVVKTRRLTLPANEIAAIFKSSRIRQLSDQGFIKPFQPLIWQSVSLLKWGMSFCSFYKCSNYNVMKKDILSWNKYHNKNQQLSSINDTEHGLHGIWHLPPISRKSPQYFPTKKASTNFPTEFLDAYFFCITLRVLCVCVWFEKKKGGDRHCQTHEDKQRQPHSVGEKL